MVTSQARCGADVLCVGRTMLLPVTHPLPFMMAGTYAAKRRIRTVRTTQVRASLSLLQIRSSNPRSPREAGGRPRGVLLVTRSRVPDAGWPGGR